MWQPETFPIEYAIATIVSPNASAVATYAPLASAPLQPVIAATPQPTNVRTNVPISSAKYFFMKRSLYICVRR